MTKPCLCGHALPTCGEIDGTGCPKLPAPDITACPGCGARSSENYDGRGSCWTCYQRTTPTTAARERGTTATRDEERPLHSPTSFLVPSNTSSQDGEAAPSNSSGKLAEVEALLSAHQAGRRTPVEIELPPVPESRSTALAEVAEFFRLVYGLRVAAGEERAVPFAAGWIAAKLGLEKQTAYRLRCQLVASGVLVKARPLPGRDGKRGTDTFLPGHASEGPDW